MLIKNAKIETGFEWQDCVPIQTKTAYKNIRIKAGKIEEIDGSQSEENEIVFDAESLLLLPAFEDLHTHLDKHYFGLPWQAHLPQNKTVKDMIAYEQKIIPELLKTTVSRTKKLIAHYQSYGNRFARTHVNIDSTSGLQSLEKLQESLQAKSNTFDYEIVISWDI